MRIIVCFCPKNEFRCICLSNTCTFNVSPVGSMGCAVDSKSEPRMWPRPLADPGGGGRTRLAPPLTAVDLWFLYAQNASNGIYLNKERFLKPIPSCKYVNPLHFYYLNFICYQEYIDFSSIYSLPCSSWCHYSSIYSALYIVCSDVWAVPAVPYLLFVQMYGPFLQLGAVCLMTATTWLIAAHWITLSTLGKHGLIHTNLSLY